jgi:hypothetical protein
LCIGMICVCKSYKSLGQFFFNKIFYLVCLLLILLLSMMVGETGKKRLNF